MLHPFSGIGPFSPLRLLVKEIKGLENVYKKGPFIIAANHESYIDPPLIYEFFKPLLNKKIHFVAGKRFSFLGKTICTKWLGCILKSDENGKTFSTVLEYLNKGRVIGIFIQEKFHNGRQTKLHSSPIRLAIAAKCPLQLVHVKGTGDILPLPKLIPKKIRRVTLSISPPIFFEKYYNRRVSESVIEKEKKGIGKILYSL